MEIRVLGAVAVTSALALAGAAAGSAAGGGADSAQTAQQPAQRLLAPGSRYLVPQIRRYRRATWHWQRLMGKPLTRTGRGSPHWRKPAYRRWVRNVWRKRAAKERRRAHAIPRRSAWLCIYRHERNPRQGWRTRTGNGFYGGLQMNISFQRTYGAHLLRRKGTADRWTPIEQMWVAERAYRSGQGFYPWPNTARYCGLI